jgi:hypothetical protein
VPPPQALPEDDETERHDTDGRPAGQGTRDAPGRRASEDGDHNGEDQVEEVNQVEQVELRRGHAPLHFA